MSELDDFEKKQEERIKINSKYIEEFEKWLIKKGLTEKTIRNHIQNVSLYINDYLIYYDDCSMEKGCICIDSFLGDWFIRKCLWSTAYSVKTTAASIKKFYQCMAELGEIEKDRYEFLRQEIKDNMDDWIDAVEEYNSDDFDVEW